MSSYTINFVFEYFIFIGILFIFRQKSITILSTLNRLKEPVDVIDLYIGFYWLAPTFGS